ncbi:hypothetical protein [Methanobacterium aggregans]|uniref:hypothetical protein n=1 Tax=Methanobacterium aggregans TaxID=1615586 RepID=UPI001AE2C7B1|nr:hypothetical protein [Methanobacterium aggregans]MBP2045869.1 hypothetical protein [Methanobacterium aggregans]
MGFNKIHDDKRGQAFSMDLLLALVVITVLIGVSADAMDIVSYKIQDYSFEHSMQRITMDAAETLINTPGNPSNWETLSGMITPGLAEVDPETGRTVPGTLSIKKINKLKHEYDTAMPTILPDGSDSTITIYPLNDLPPILVHDEIPPASSSDVAVANRTVLCSYMYMACRVSMNVHSNPSWSHGMGSDWEICPHAGLNASMKHEKPDFETGKPGWVCHHFNITQEDLNSTDFYVLTDPTVLADGSARWIIDSPDKMEKNGEMFFSSPIPVNDKLMEILGDNKTAVLWLHVLTIGTPDKSFDAYVVGVPKGTPVLNVRLEYITPQPAYFILKVWV